MLAPSALTRAHALSGNPPSPRSPLVPTRVLCFPQAERRRGGDWPHASVRPLGPRPGPAGPFLLPRPTCPRPATLLSVRGHSGASPSPAPPHQLPPRGGSPPCPWLVHTLAPGPCCPPSTPTADGISGLQTARRWLPSQSAAADLSTLCLPAPAPVGLMSTRNEPVHVGIRFCPRDPSRGHLLRGPFLPTARDAGSGPVGGPRT